MSQLLLKPRVFVSHSSVDTPFAKEVAVELGLFHFKVWYDDWEIAIGESIVERVFAGLNGSDVLLIVLSRAAVASRWVKEELDVAVMRRLSENDIRILPVLIENCDVPTPLRHIRYADFREHRAEAMSQLLDSLAPGHLAWQSLAEANDHFRLVCDEILRLPLNSEDADKLLRLHSLLESALNLRTEIEFRRTRQKMDDLSFFEKIGVLCDSGVDVRSLTWNALVRYRAEVAHSVGSHRTAVDAFAYMLKERHKTKDIRKRLSAAFESLKKIMDLLCFETWENDSLGDWKVEANESLEGD